MDASRSDFLRLPLELRQQVYELCFDAVPGCEGFLFANRQIRDEVFIFLCTRQQSFTLNISGEDSKFTDVSTWCSILRHHILKVGNMKYLVMNIYPANQSEPLEMWNLWRHLVTLCTDLGVQGRVPQTTISFVDSDNATWATAGKLHCTLDLSYPGKIGFDLPVGCGDVYQIIIIFFRWAGSDNTNPCQLFGDLQKRRRRWESAIFGETGSASAFGRVV